MLKKMIHSPLTRILLTTLVVTTSGGLLADDDDEGYERHHHAGHSESHERRHGAKNGGMSSPSQSLRQLEAVSQPKWEAECKSCHMLYHPGLLPARSWKLMMSQLDKHFGDNASLDDKTRNEITEFLTSHSADQSKSRRSAKINASIPASETPLRISKTKFFERKHHEIGVEVFKREKIGSAANCLACHKEAERGYFSEDTVKIPK